MPRVPPDNRGIVSYDIGRVNEKSAHNFVFLCVCSEISITGRKPGGLPENYPRRHCCGHHPDIRRDYQSVLHVLDRASDFVINQNAHAL
jgi:hypothetical protein